MHNLATYLSSMAVSLSPKSSSLAKGFDSSKSSLLPAMNLAVLAGVAAAASVTINDKGWGEGPHIVQG